jgi:hypothetical protein
MRNKYVNMNREALLGTKYNQMTREKKLYEAREVSHQNKKVSSGEIKPGLLIRFT